MDWQQGESLAGIARAVEHLRGGRLVALPTESVYMLAAAPLVPGVLTALDAVVGQNTPLTILLGHAVEVFDWLPFFRGVGVRLARRFWPGPLTLVSGTGLKYGHFPYLPREVQDRLAPDQHVALRFPHHEVARQVALQLGTPLVAAMTSAITPDQLTTAVTAQTALIIQDGRTAFAEPDSIVQVNGREWRLQQAGAISAEEIDQAVPCRIMFVCTGNTCRSPLAEGICRKLLADSLNCSCEDLIKRGYLVQSAGLAASPGHEATPEAVVTGRECGANLTGHLSQPLTIELLLDADRLFAMTANHLRMLCGVRGVTPRLLDLTGEDVDDPIGGTPDVYRDCARHIKSCLEQLLPELLEC